MEFPFFGLGLVDLGVDPIGKLFVCQVAVGFPSWSFNFRLGDSGDLKITTLNTLEGKSQEAQNRHKF